MIELYNDNCLNLMQTSLQDQSIDVICIDPPYLYLKGQKLERPFDEPLFFSECKRVLVKDGFIVMFGRGESFYRWNTILADLGFKFKEEIVWDKSYSSSPLMALSRVHETVSIFTKGKGVINRSKVPYLEMKRHDINSVCQDVMRMRTILKNPRSLQAVEDFLSNNAPSNTSQRKHNTSVSVQESRLINKDRAAAVMEVVKEGLNEKTIIRTDRSYTENSQKWKLNSESNTGDRCVNVIQSFEYGLNEKTVIKEVRDHYSAIHPTQKPVRLIERLLALVIPKNKPIENVVVADFFAGSMSCMEAVHNIGCKGIACEIDKEFFEKGEERIKKISAIQRDLFSV